MIRFGREWARDNLASEEELEARYHVQPRAALRGAAEFRRLAEEDRRRRAASERVSKGGGPSAEASTSEPVGAALGVCRICYEDIKADDDGVHPCECKSDGVLTVAHRSCVQHWISLRPNLPQHSLARSDPRTCECCGAAWKQTFMIPEPPAAPPTRDQQDERARTLLLDAYTRQGVGGLQSRDADALILRELGPMYDGPWRRHTPTQKASVTCAIM